MTTDEIGALEPNARRRLGQFRDCFKKSPVFDYFVYYSLGSALSEKSGVLVGQSHEALGQLEYFLGQPPGGCDG